MTIPLPAHVELPCLAGRHHHGPADEEAHHGEGEERGLPAHRVHQEDGAEAAEEGAQGQQAACRWRVRTGDMGLEAGGWRLEAGYSLIQEAWSSVSRRGEAIMEGMAEEV